MAPWPGLRRRHGVPEDEREVRESAMASGAVLLVPCRQTTTGERGEHGKKKKGRERAWARGRRKGLDPIGIWALTGCGFVRC